MSRGKAYTRKMRAKHIQRKKNIVLHAMPWLASLNNGNGWYYFDGQYSKGKIHCSCKLCSSKAFYGGHILDMQERKQLEKMASELEELLTDEIYDQVG